MKKLALTFAMIATALPALAFDRSDAKLLQQWAVLENFSMDGREAKVFAIVDGDDVLYVITQSIGGQLYPLGTFNCNQAFEITTRKTNGWAEISCVHNGTRRTLRADDGGSYGG